MTTEEAREADAEAVATIIAMAQNVPFVGARQRKIADVLLASDWFASVQLAGIAEGRRQAREAAANVDPIESALSGSDAAVSAIDALGGSNERRS